MNTITEVQPGSFIYEAPTALPIEFCKHIVSTFETDKLAQRVGATRRGDSKYKITTDALVDRTVPHWAEIDAELFRLISPMAIEYVNMHFGLQEYALRDTGYIVGRYTAGVGEYKWHADETDLNEKIRLRMSMILYLNDVAEGGETEFLHQKILVKPQIGKAVLFPGAWTHVHRGNVPVSNDKYIITTFFFSSEK